MFPFALSNVFFFDEKEEGVLTYFFVVCCFGVVLDDVERDGEKRRGTRTPRERDAFYSQNYSQNDDDEMNQSIIFYSSISTVMNFLIYTIFNAACIAFVAFSCSSIRLSCKSLRFFSSRLIASTSISFIKISAPSLTP